MARKVEKKTLRITENDKAFFQLLAKSGRCFAEDANTYFRIKKSRLNQMVHNKWIEREPIVVNREMTYCYRLTDKSIRWIKRNIPTVSKLYRPCKTGTLHDIALFRQLASLPKHIQDVAMTEADVIDKFGKLSTMSPPDLYIPQVTRRDIATGAVITTPPMIIEVISKNYSTAEIQAKYDYCSHFLNTEKGGIRLIESK